MLVDRILYDLDTPAPEDSGGNPIRGSRLGRCARQSAYMLYPSAYPPEPLPARSKLVFAFGDMVHELVRRHFRRVVPGQWGMEEARFWLPVPLSTKAAEAARLKIETGELPGYHLIRTAPPVPGERVSLVLDLAGPVLYVSLHVDGIADCGPVYGLAAAEIKSMTTAGFRRALAGHVDYSYRVQMAAAVEATALDTELYVAVRKDTCHLLEVLYSRRVDKVRVTFTKQSTLVAVREVEIDDWEAALVEHPFEPDLIEEARARVGRILLATPTRLPEREHAPDFTCRTCDGTGQQVNAKNTRLPLKRGPKPCEDCHQRGRLEEAELTWQCRYCPWVWHCWKDAKPRLDFDKDAKPHIYVTRDAVLTAGIPLPVATTIPEGR